MAGWEIPELQLGVVVGKNIEPDDGFSIATFDGGYPFGSLKRTRDTGISQNTWPV